MPTNAENVTVKILGGQEKVLEVFTGTVGDLKASMNVPNHTALVNGQPAADDDTIASFSFVRLAPAVKGA